MIKDFKGEVGTRQVRGVHSIHTAKVTTGQPYSADGLNMAMVVASQPFNDNNTGVESVRHCPQKPLPSNPLALLSFGMTSPNGTKKQADSIRVSPPNLDTVS